MGAFLRTQALWWLGIMPWFFPLALALVFGGKSFVDGYRPTSRRQVYVVLVLLGFAYLGWMGSRPSH